MGPDTDLETDLAAMKAICAVVAEEAGQVHPADRLRQMAVLVYLSDDEAACKAAEDILRASLKEPAPRVSEPAAVAMVCWHAIMVDELSAAGYEISLPEDPGPGRIPAVFVVGRMCVRSFVEIDPAAAARHDALMAELEALPGEVLAACSDVIAVAVSMGDDERRRRSAIVVCACNDPKACEVARAVMRKHGKSILLEPDKAVGFLHAHAEVARLAKAHGYVFESVPDPAIGRMRVFLFLRGGVIAIDMQIESEADVARKHQQEQEAGSVEARRIFESKERLVMKAVDNLLRADPGLLKTKIIVVFGSRSKAALAVYRELAAMPEQRAFPPELPDGVPVVSVTYEDFMASVRRQPGADQVKGVDAAKLGPNQVRVATFTSEGLDIQRMESLGLGRGGVA